MLEELVKSVFKLIIVGIVGLSLAGLVILATESGKNDKLNKDYTSGDGVTIESQFSSWDGSHYKTIEIIKSLMKNPSSFEHVKTSYTESGDTLTVYTQYRGTNSFNAVVTEYITVIYDLNSDKSIDSIKDIIQ